MPHSPDLERLPIGSILTRAVVPLWILAGAVFKLVERNPGNLPVAIRTIAKDLSVDLDFLLRTLVGLELFAVAVMLFVPRLARTMAVFMLVSFCVILIREMSLKATSCGCFGSLPMKPWHMLVIDGTLLAGVLMFRPRTNESRTSLFKPFLAVIPLALLGLATSFLIPDRPAIVQKPSSTGSVQTTQPSPPQTQPQDDSTTSAGSTLPTPVVTQPADPTVNPTPAPIPPTWYIKEKDGVREWVGKGWRELDLFQVMTKWPKDLDHGKHFVIFYSRSCEHCRDMYEQELMAIPLDGPVSLIEIPHTRDEMTAPDAWEMPKLEKFEYLNLPMGSNWLMTPPLILRLENGVVKCATEGEEFEGQHKQCLELQ